MYAALAASELRGAEAYDLRGGFGAQLPIQPLTPDGLAELITTWNERKEARALGIAVDATACGKLATLFLSGELDRTVKVAEALRTGSSATELKRLLADADFLYAHFPDPDRVLALEEDALKRVAAEAAYWRGRLEAAIGQH